MKKPKKLSEKRAFNRLAKTLRRERKNALPAPAQEKSRDEVIVESGWYTR